MAGFSEMHVHINQTRTDNFSGRINNPRIRLLASGLRFYRFGFIPAGNLNNFVILDQDIGNRIQMSGVDNSAALNGYSHHTFLR